MSDDTAEDIVEESVVDHSTDEEAEAQQAVMSELLGGEESDYVSFSMTIAPGCNIAFSSTIDDYREIADDLREYISLVAEENRRMTELQTELTMRMIDNGFPIEAALSAGDLSGSGQSSGDSMIV